jgi:hypothetical protein
VAGLGVGRALGFVAPALLLIGAFLVFPALWTIYIGITNYRLTGVEAVSPSIVGMSNYTKALNDALFHNALWLTLLFVLGSAIIGQNILGFTLAWVMRRTRPVVRRTVEGLVLLAWDAEQHPRYSGHRLADRLPDGLSGRVQHVARYGVLDDALLIRATGRAALAVGIGTHGRSVRVADVARRGVPAHPGARAHEHPADLTVDGERLLALPAHQGRAEPRVRDGARLHLQRGAPRR